MLLGKPRLGASADAGSDGPRLPGLTAGAAKMLPFLHSEPPCAACSFTMSPQGRDRTGACDVCSAPSAAEPLGFFHECLTCGRRVCAGCSQREEVRRLTKKAQEDVRERAGGASRMLEDQVSEVEDTRKRTVAELAEAEAERQASISEAEAEQAAARAGKEALVNELQIERESLKRSIAEAEEDLNARECQLRETLDRLKLLREEIAVAPRPPPQEDEKTIELRSQLETFRALAAERESEAEMHQKAATAEQAQEKCLRTELADMQEAGAISRARRLCSLAFTRAELNAERRAAEEAVEEEMKVALAEESEKEKERLRADEQRRAAGAAAALAAADNAADASEGDGVIGRFLDKLAGFVDNMEPLMVPAAGEMAWGLPMEMQMGLPGMSEESANVSSAHQDAAFQPPQRRGLAGAELQDEDAQALRLERTAWERRSEQCERQLEWMKRDAERRAAEIATLTAELERLRIEGARSRSSADELEQELARDQRRMREYHRRLRESLEKTVISCRERILAALKHGSSQTTSELESLYDDTANWSAPGGARISEASFPTKDHAPDTALADADCDTFVAGLASLCDDLERCAVDAAEEARSSGNLCDAMNAFNAASDAMEATDAFPGSESPLAAAAPTSMVEDSLAMAAGTRGSVEPSPFQTPSFPQSIVQETSDWPEAATEQGIVAAGGRDESAWPEAADESSGTAT